MKASLTALVVLGATWATMAESAPQNPEHCSIKSEPNQHATTVDLCDKSGLTLSVPTKEVQRFLKKPFGSSNHSLPKDVDRAKRKVIKDVEKALSKIGHW